MSWSLKLGRFAGIDVFVHWTFAILLAWIFIGHLSAGQDLAAALRGVSFILALFGCVVRHEFGHALSARRYGMCRECRTVQAGEPLENALENLRQSDGTAASVLQDGQLIGLLTLENIGELVMVNAALEGRGNSGAA